MKNRIKKYRLIKKARFNESVDKKLAQELVRAEEDSIVAVKNNSAVKPADQDSDCWGDLWQRIKTQYARFHRKKQ